MIPFVFRFNPPSCYIKPPNSASDGRRVV